MNPPYQYVVLHRSAAKDPGIAAVQGIHAATEAIGSPMLGALTVSPDTHVIVLVAEKSEDLVALAEKLSAAGVRHVLIREPDPPYNGAATAVGLAPQDRDAVRGFVSHFKVLR